MVNKIIKFIITGNPISSKNSIRSGITKQGRNYTYTQANVKAYRTSVLKQLKEQIKIRNCVITRHSSDGTFTTKSILPITVFCEVSFIFYCIDNRKRDLCNLIQCPADLLQQAGIIENDYLIRSLDGSRIADIDKINPRTEITIEVLK